MSRNGQMKNYNYDASKISARRKTLDSIKELMKKNPAKAKAELSKHLEAQPDDMYSWFYYGQLCQRESNIEEAEYAYTLVASSDSKNKYAGVVGQADIARIKGKIDEAKKLYLKAITENPAERATTYYILARLESATGNPTKALELLNRLPQTSETQIEILRIYSDMGDCEIASKLSEQIYPTTALEERNLYFEKAKLAIRNNDLTLAQYYFLKAREYKIKDHDYYKILEEEARLAIMQNNYQLVMDNCNEALSDKENFHGYIYQMFGQVYERQGQFKEAMQWYRMTKTEPGVTYAAKARNSYFLGRLEMIMGDFASAEIDLKESFNPSLSPYHVVVELLLNIYIRHERFAEANAFIDRIRKTYPDDYYNDEQLNFASFLIDCLQGKQVQPNKYSYREKQAVNYSKSEAIKHIETKHQDSKDNGNGIFAQTLDIATLYDDVLPQLTEDNRTIVDMSDRYIIEYPNVGITKDGDLADCICVITMPGTDKIITMYPSELAKKTTKKDIMKAMTTEKPKENSRISRFNSRYANYIPPIKK